MVLSLLLTSCASDDTPETENTPETQETQDEQPAGYADPEEPKYGGEFVRIRTADVSVWDYAAGRDMFTITLMGEEILMGDWTRGPSGTYENDWSGGFAGFIDMLTGKRQRNDC